jgi:hypothetical protein
MKTVEALRNQTVFDIAAQHYGNTAAFEEILELNPGIRNDFTNIPDEEIVDRSEFDFAFPVMEGMGIIINENSEMMRLNVLRELNGVQIISFDKIDTE